MIDSQTWTDRRKNRQTDRQTGAEQDLQGYPSRRCPLCRGGTPWHPGFAVSGQPDQPHGSHTQTSPRLLHQLFFSGLGGVRGATVLLRVGKPVHPHPHSHATHLQWQMFFGAFPGQKCKALFNTLASALWPSAWPWAHGKPHTKTPGASGSQCKQCQLLLS